MDITQEAKEVIKHHYLVDAYLIDIIERLLDRWEKLEEDNRILKNCMRNAREVYISMDGFKPETAPEGYCLWLLEQMYNELCDKPLPPVGDK